VAQVGERGPDPLELLAGVEQGLDHLQLDQVPVGVAPPAAAALGVGQGGAHEVGASAVVELAVGDADDVGGLAAGKALVHARAPARKGSRWWVSIDIGGVTPMSWDPEGTEARARRQRDRVFDPGAERDRGARRRSPRDYR